MGLPVIKPENITRCEAVTDVLQSVAMIQKALSHILNAEAEKIAKILEDEDVSSDDILAVNKSVNSVVQSASMLQMTQLDKVNVFKDCVCTKCE